ncbi:reverse transcriptase domain-containing protein [Tanacetum coccineum]|uniref:Reverse transcriptase domain-containing protein n=1 Tax=Tanacetum coccineum TaxID=301880 RepID=A0ABQ4Y413_9ASTR
MTARISIRDEPSISLPPREEVERLLALTTPPPSPLTPLSSPLPQIPSPPLPIPSPPPNSPTHIEIPESCLPLRKRARRPAIAREDPYSIARGDLYGFFDMVDVAPGHPMSRELDYGITDTWDDLVGAIDEIALTTLEGVNQRVTDLATIVEQETTIMDRPVSSYDLAVMIEREAKMAHEAWGLSMDASDYARSDVMSLRTTVVAQSALISELQSVDHRRQRVISELLAIDHKRQVQLTKALRLLKGLQTQMVEFQRQHGPAKGRTADEPGEAKMQPKEKTTRLNPSATPTPVTDTHTTTSVTNAQIQAMINEGVTAALAARDATRNGDDSHTSGTGARRPMRNSHVKTTTHEAAHAMPWRTLKKMMSDKYCPRGEIKKLEFEMWNLKVKGNDVVTYSQRFQELSLMCDRMFPEEIYQDAIEFATELMDKKINTWAERQANNKIKWCIVVKEGEGSVILRTIRSLDLKFQITITMIVLRVSFEYGAPGAIFKKDVPKMEEQQQPGNQAGNVKAGQGANRSCVSTAFSSRIIITPTTLDHDYNVELADGRIVGLNTIIRGKANVVADALSRKEREPLRVRALVMTIGLDLPKQILKAQTEAKKPENIKKEDVGGILVENCESLRNRSLQPIKDDSQNV